MKNGRFWALKQTLHQKTASSAANVTEDWWLELVHRILATRHPQGQGSWDQRRPDLAMALSWAERLRKPRVEPKTGGGDAVKKFGIPWDLLNSRFFSSMMMSFFKTKLEEYRRFTYTSSNSIILSFGPNPNQRSRVKWFTGKDLWQVDFSWKLET